MSFNCIVVYNIGKLVKTYKLNFTDSMTIQTFDLGIKEIGKYKEFWEGGKICERGYIDRSSG